MLQPLTMDLQQQFLKSFEAFAEAQGLIILRPAVGHCGPISCHNESSGGYKE